MPRKHLLIDHTDLVLMRRIEENKKELKPCTAFTDSVKKIRDNKHSLNQMSKNNRKVTQGVQSCLNDHVNIDTPKNVHIAEK